MTGSIRILIDGVRLMLDAAMARSISASCRNLTSDRLRARTFARRLHHDPSIQASDLLYVELYPFHSKRVTGPIAPPPDLLTRFILNPIAELEVPFVFAFGKPWLTVAKILGLGEGRALPVGWTTPSRDARSYPLTNHQSLIVMTQRGYAGPPGAADTEALRAAIGY